MIMLVIVVCGIICSGVGLIIYMTNLGDFEDAGIVIIITGLAFMFLAGGLFITDYVSLNTQNETVEVNNTIIVNTSNTTIINNITENNGTIISTTNLINILNTDLDDDYNLDGI